MRKLHWIVLSAGIATGVAMIVLLRDRSAPPSTAEVVASSVPDVTLGNRASIDRAVDDRRIRDFAFRKVRDRFAAEGVALDAAGELTVTSQSGRGARLVQRLVAAELQGSDGGTERIARRERPEIEAEASAKAGSVRYRQLFEGLDVEYRYDGKDVEELIHVDEGLRQRLASASTSVVLTSQFPGLRDGPTLLNGSDLLPQSMPAPPDGAPPAVQRTWKRVELSTADGLFILPESVAISGTDRLTLARSFSWSPEGLAVRVEVPGSWLARTRAPVVIDPAIIDGPRTVDGVFWPGQRNIVRDASGTLHVGYRAVFQGQWRAMYARGSGSSWQVVGPLPFGPCEDWQAHPTLAIDSRGTLHAVWADYNHPGGCADTRGTANPRHRIHHAWCADNCRGGQWQGGGLILPVGDGHQYNYSLAVGADDALHLAFYPDNGNVRYMSNANDGTGWVNGGVVLETAYYPTIDVDGQNRPHIVAGAYYCYSSSYLTKHTYFDPGTGSWVRTPDLEAPPKTAPYGCCYWQSMAIDAADNVHVAQQFRDGCDWYAEPYPWRIHYGRWDTGAWRDSGYIDSSYEFREHGPTVTIDDGGKLHAAWYQGSTPSKVIYAQKASGAAWSVSVPLLPNSPGQVGPSLRGSRYPASNRSMPPDLLDLVYVEDFSFVSYLSTGAPVEAPVGIRPLDHTYTNDTTPTFRWRRTGSDNGANTTYRLEIDSTPLFSAPLITKVGLTTDTYTLSGVAPEAFENGRYYYWRLQSVNAFGPGPYGQIFELGVDTQPPSPFDLVRPADGSDPGTKTPTFEWTESLD